MSLGGSYSMAHQLGSGHSGVLAGVMGWPVSHSRSPIIHQHWMQEHGIRGAYLPLPVPEHRLASAIQGLPALGFSGCNLTVPHKVQALQLVDELTPQARHVAAINTIIVRSDGSLLGDNTDGWGYIQSLLQANPAWQPDTGPALVLGAGGAARAIVAALLEQGVPEIRITNRTAENAQTLADIFGARVRVVAWGQRNAAMTDVRLLVNTTTLGMHGQPELEVKLDALPSYAMVSDVVYTPLETPLLKTARQRGHVAVDGLGMLLHQAAPAFEAWFGVRPQVTAQLRALVLATFRSA